MPIGLKECGSEHHIPTTGQGAGKAPFLGFTVLDFNNTLLIIMADIVINIETSPRFQIKSEFLDQTGRGRGNVTATITVR